MKSVVIYNIPWVSGEVAGGREVAIWGGGDVSVGLSFLASKGVVLQGGWLHIWYRERYNRPCGGWFWVAC